MGNNSDIYYRVAPCKAFKEALLKAEVTGELKQHLKEMNHLYTMAKTIEWNEYLTWHLSGKEGFMLQMQSVKWCPSYPIVESSEAVLSYFTNNNDIDAACRIEIGEEREDIQCEYFGEKGYYLATVDRSIAITE